MRKPDREEILEPMVKAGTEAAVPYRIGLGSLMVAIAFFGVCFAAFRVHPAFGIALACVTCLALVRAFGAASRRKVQGMPMTLREEVVLLLNSLVVAATILTSSAVAFLAALVSTSATVAFLVSAIVESFFAGLLLKAVAFVASITNHYIGPEGALIALVAGIAAAVYTTYRLKRALWPVKERTAAASSSAPASTSDGRAR